MSLFGFNSWIVLHFKFLRSPKNFAPKFRVPLIFNFQFFLILILIVHNYITYDTFRCEIPILRRVDSICFEVHEMYHKLNPCSGVTGFNRFCAQSQNIRLYCMKIDFAHVIPILFKMCLYWGNGSWVHFCSHFSTLKKNSFCSLQTKKGAGKPNKKQMLTIC